MSYQSVVGETVTEKIIEKSRFITCVMHVEGEEEAKAYLNQLHALHPLSTHICYAYIADKTGNFIRFSDDGEPQGTAGMPILGVIKAKKLYETLVAVVRYFGGVKLGAGGLTRAYAGCASEGVNAAKVVLFDLCEEIAVGVCYSDVKTLTRFAEDKLLLEREYGEKTVFTFRIRNSDEEQFVTAVQNEFRGRAEIQKRGKGYYPCE